MRKPQGYAIITDPEAPTQEFDTVTCGHCQVVTHLKAFEDPAETGGLCYACNRLICKGCVGHPCDVIEEKIKRWEASYHARRSYFGCEGL